MLSFNPYMLHRSEFLTEAKSVSYFDVHHTKKHLQLDANSLFFTYCQVPVVYKIAGENSIEILFNNGTSNKLLSLNLDIASSAKLFDRTGEIQQIIVSIDHQKLINS